MIKLILIFMLALAGCSSSLQKAVDKTDESLSTSKKDLCSKGECPCDSPLGSVAHGSKVTIYDVSTVACSERCDAHATQITCNNGKFDKDPAGKSFTCSAKECASCSLGTNLIRHGESVDAFTTATADCGLSCEDMKQVRKCTNGKLDGDDAHNQTSCQMRQCRCDLPDGSGYLSLGGKMTFFSAQVAACGKTCADYKTDRTCNSTGTGAARTFALDKDASFKYQACAEATGCTCNLPNGLGVINNGETATLDSVATVTCGSTCSAANRITVKCNAGTLNRTDTNAVVIASTTLYKYQCQPQICKYCQVDGGTSVISGTSLAFYTNASPDCGKACTDLKVTRTCLADGTWDKPGTFASSCQERLCKCANPSSPGNSVYVNGTLTFYTSNRATCGGSSCQSMGQPATCLEKNASGNYTYAFNNDTSHQSAVCTPATGCSCQLPGSLGSIATGKAVTLSKKASVSCGDSCANYPSTDLNCVDGVLRSTSGDVVDASKSDFLYQCQTPTCPDCTLTGYGATIVNNTSVTLYSKGGLGCGEDPAQFASNFKCDGGVLRKGGSVYDPSKDPMAPTQWFSTMADVCVGCKTAWGVTIREGVKIMAYKKSGINACGQGCKSQQQTCTKGVLSGDLSYNIGSCENTCTQEGGGAPPRGCLLPWSNSFVTPDSQIPMYSRKTVKCGDSCQNYFKLGTCNMQTGRFDVGYEYIHQSCTEVCP